MHRASFPPNSLRFLPFTCLPLLCQPLLTLISFYLLLSLGALPHGYQSTYNCGTTENFVSRAFAVRTTCLCLNSPSPECFGSLMVGRSGPAWSHMLPPKPLPSVTIARLFASSCAPWGIMRWFLKHHGCVKMTRQFAGPMTRSTSHPLTVANCACLLYLLCHSRLPLPQSRIPCTPNCFMRDTFASSRIAMMGSIQSPSLLWTATGSHFCRL